MTLLQSSNQKKSKFFLTNTGKYLEKEKPVQYFSQIHRELIIVKNSHREDCFEDSF